MEPDQLDALRARRPDLRARWAEMLRVEPVSTPLANPGALVHLIDWTLEEIFRDLAAAPAPAPAAEDDTASGKPQCPCGRNPLLAYFAAAERVLREGLILSQAALPRLDPTARDAALAELNHILRTIAQREIESFCAVCVHRHATTEAACHP